MAPAGGWIARKVTHTRFSKSSMHDADFLSALLLVWLGIRLEFSLAQEVTHRQKVCFVEATRKALTESLGCGFPVLYT
jgi:hypothetical protein